MKCELTGTPEQELDPPEGYEWTKENMKRATERLVDNILFNNTLWDENIVSYKLDMFCEWESTMLQEAQGLISCEEAFALMHDALCEYVEAYAKEKVEENPDRYCEVEEDD